MASNPISSLPPRGYQVFDLGLSDSIITSLLNEAKSLTYKSVFEKVGGNDDDEFRAQSRVTASGAVTELQCALLDSTNCINSAWIPREFSYMRSLPGGREQESHQDYPPGVLKAQARKGRIPASMIFAFQGNTQLKVFSGCFESRNDSEARVVKIPVGFCVIFRGDLIHNGVAYDAINHRIHCYLAFEGMRWEPDVVSSVLRKTYACQFCGLKMYESDKMRKHRWLCVKNPSSGKNKEKRKRENDPLPVGKLVCCVCERGYTNRSSYRTHISRPHKM